MIHFNGPKFFTVNELKEGGQKNWGWVIRHEGKKAANAKETFYQLSVGLKKWRISRSMIECFRNLFLPILSSNGTDLSQRRYFCFSYFSPRFAKFS